jgi:hypothetical protein
MRSIYLQSFMLIPLIVLELCAGQSSKCKNKQRAMIQKLGQAELRFLRTAHLLNEIYPSTKFHVDTSCCFKIMSRTRKADGRTDGRTRRRLYAPPKFFGEHKKCIILFVQGVYRTFLIIFKRSSKKSCSS